MRANRWFTPWLLVLPALVWLLAFSPLAVDQHRPAVVHERQPARGREPVGGPAELRDAARGPQVWEALLNSVIYMAVCLPLLTVLPLLMPCSSSGSSPASRSFRTAYYTPVIASAVVVGLIWNWILDDRGVINEMAQHLGIVQSSIPFLTDRWLLVFSAISLTVWKGLGYYMIIFLAALGNVGKDLHEAAALDGAGSVRRFWSVTMPGVRGTMTLVGILVCVSALRVFSELYILTNGTGGPGGQDNSLVMLIQQYARGFTGNLGYASALSLLLFVVTLIPMLALARMNSKADK